MKKILIGLVLFLITMSVSAQLLNKKYDLFYLDGKSMPQSAYYIGAFIRNDTIFITPGAIVNVVSIQNEDSTWKHILLKPFREPWYKIPTHSTPSAIVTKQDSTKIKKQ